MRLPDKSPFVSAEDVDDSATGDRPSLKRKLRPFGKSDWIRVAIIVFLLVASTAVIIYYMPFFLSLRDSQIRMQWISQLRNMGPGGFFAALGIQVAQVVLAAIPGEPVEIAMGYLYGTWGGLGVCLLGIFIGTLIILVLVKVLGGNFVKMLIKEETMSKLKFLHNEGSLETVVFVLFLIPGTPKDLLTYFVPLTPIKPLRFLVIATFARIPSVVTSTLIGASLGSRRWGLSIVVFILTAVMGLIGIQINNWYLKKRHGSAKSAPSDQTPLP